ncbi:family 2 glycosyl transferase [Natrialba chahannaoensis JCM 10990]|uniref:Family 2 glycosyl transferase n=1 Tax=Natrialba chahannaoensis JCM 10990 TaxID=1227492 RepID=M0A379_9EURY|nr:glycosyltransferase family 2 protein [Natrialba chahannaoensis]ELY93029.1 family 2 glycosyl transferase [Natrialba chahannaoensis JCM 10990]
MYRDHSIGVVIPAYNEEGFVGDVIRGMPDYVDRMYLIDDCSTDGSWDEIRKAARDDAEVSELEYTGSLSTDGDSESTEEQPKTITDGGTSTLEQRAIVHNSIGRVVPIQHRENLGAGGAIKTGYLAALEDAVDIVPTVDGDGQMDLRQLPKLLDPIVEDEADYAKGNRLLYKEYRTDMPPFRFFGNSILTFLTKIASGYWKTMDPQNGYTAISHYALANVGIEDMYEYYGYCNDLLVKLNAKGMRVADVAIPAVYGDEESSINYTTYIRKVSGMLLRNFFWRQKVKYLVLDFHPLALFYLFGTATAGLGLIGGLWSLYAKVALGDPLFVRGASSLLLFSVGSMFLMFAMLFDMQASENREVQIRNAKTQQ